MQKYKIVARSSLVNRATSSIGSRRSHTIMIKSYSGVQELEQGDRKGIFENTANLMKMSVIFIDTHGCVSFV